MPPALVPDELRFAPFTAVHAATYGVTRAALRGDLWRNVFRGVWVHRDVPDTLDMRFAAVRLILPDGVFVCGLTAAWLDGIEVQDRRGERVWIGLRTGRRVRTRTGCEVREITVEDGDLRLVDGVWLTTPVRTVFDCGRWLSLVEGVVVADALSHAGLASRTEIATYTATHRKLRWVRRMDLVVELMEPKSESPMESRLRMLIVLAGLPRPEAQLVVLDRRGKFVARADLGYEAQKLIVEYDGAFHWEQRREDDRRRDAMRNLGWTVLVVSRDDYYETPEAIVSSVRHHLAK